MKSFSSDSGLSVFALIPSIGVILFFLFFIYAASLYPGGTQFDKSTQGFDWVNNYWCELATEEAINGQPNAAMPYAVTGMLFLGVGISVFCYLMPVWCESQRPERILLRLGGIITAAFAALLFTEYHHEMLLGFSIFTLLTMVLTLMILFNNSCFWQFIVGLAGLVCVQINNYIYYTRSGIEYLPLLQKLTIAFVLLWVIALNIWFVFYAKRPISSD
jgi:hypothetical protein